MRAPIRKSLAKAGTASLDRGALWAVVLAGGDGTRLRPLVRAVHGDERPKQFAALLGSGSLLRQTLDRIALSVPVERTVVVARWDHASFLAAEFADVVGPLIFVQPGDRGTAAGILFPVHWIQRRRPDAVVAVFPSDHFILEGRRFMAQVLRAGSFVQRYPTRLVLLGAEPTELDAEYGWIEAGPAIGGDRTGTFCEVRGFWEKPAVDALRARPAAALLWNTLIFVARASTLVELGREFVPALHEPLAWMARFLGTDDEAWAVDLAYATMPGADFSRAVLACCPSALATLRLPPLAWSDLGTPTRVARVVSKLGGALPSAPPPSAAGASGGS